MAKTKIPRVLAAVIGGSGIYDMPGMKIKSRFYPKTPFGYPSDRIIVGQLQGSLFAFLPRHGKGHRFLPSEIPQRANFYALKMMGVRFVVALSACGSLKQELAPRQFVIPSQIMDRTKGRPSTFFGDGIAAHVSFSHPFSPGLSALVADAAREAGVTAKIGGTYVCMEGPAFSTQAESLSHKKMGWDVIGMTASPEAKLAREAEMAYSLVAMVTDYDCWKEEDHVSVQMVVQNLLANAEKAKDLVARVLPKLNGAENDCANSLAGAIFTDPSAMNKATKKRLMPLIRKYVR